MSAEELPPEGAQRNFSAAGSEPQSLDLGNVFEQRALDIERGAEVLIAWAERLPDQDWLTLVRENYPHATTSSLIFSDHTEPFRYFDPTSHDIHAPADAPIAIFTPHGIYEIMRPTHTIDLHLVNGTELVEQFKNLSPAAEFSDIGVASGFGDRNIQLRARRMAQPRDPQGQVSDEVKALLGQLDTAEEAAKRRGDPLPTDRILNQSLSLDKIILPLGDNYGQDDILRDWGRRPEPYSEWRSQLPSTEVGPEAAQWLPQLPDTYYARLLARLDEYKNKLPGYELPASHVFDPSPGTYPSTAADSLSAWLGANAAKPSYFKGFDLTDYLDTGSLTQILQRYEVHPPSWTPEEIERILAKFKGRLSDLYAPEAGAPTSAAPVVEQSTADLTQHQQLQLVGETPTAWTPEGLSAWANGKIK